MTTAANPFDAILAGYVAGTLPEPARVLVASHLEISGANRRFVQDLEALAAAELSDIEPVPLKDRDDRLARIFAMPVERQIRQPQPQSDGRLPVPLRRYLGKDLEALPWRSLLPGIRECKMPMMDGCKASMLWIRAGQPMPSHTHRGSELTLVLEGGFSDKDGHYVRGDVAVADDEVDHKPVADHDGDCICFAVTDAPLRLTGPIGRLIAPFLR